VEPSATTRLQKGKRNNHDLRDMVREENARKAQIGPLIYDPPIPEGVEGAVRWEGCRCQKGKLEPGDSSPRRDRRCWPGFRGRVD